MGNPATEYRANLQIPVDLFVSKKHTGLPRGVLGFADASGVIVYRVDRHLSKSSQHKRVLLDAAGNPLISMYRDDGGSWQGFKGGGDGEKDLIFRAHRTVKKFTRTEYEVLLVGEDCDHSTSGFKMRGCPFQRSCTIYRSDTIIAQTSLMYKLHQIFVRRSKFRLTIFPGCIEHAMVVAWVVIFLG